MIVRNSFPASQHDNDAVLLIAEQDLRDCLAVADAQFEAGASESLMELLWDEAGSKAKTIFDTPPSSLIGAAVKLRMLMHPELGIEEDTNSEVMITLQQILDCIDNLISLFPG